MISGSEEEEFKAPDEEEVEPSNERSSPKRKRGRPRSGCGGHYGKQAATLINIAKNGGECYEL